MRALAAIAALLLAAWPLSAAELTKEQRSLIEDHLGKGVLGAPRAGNPIANAEKFFPFKDGAWTFRYTSGDNSVWLGVDQLRSMVASL